MIHLQNITAAAVKNHILTVLFLALSLTVSSQTKRTLTIDDLSEWNRIRENIISDDGSFCAFVYEPWDGDPVARLFDGQGSEKATFPYSSGIRFTSDSRFLIFTITTPKEEIKKLKLKKVKKDDMPVNSLGIYDISAGSTDTIYRIKSYKLPAKWPGWLAYQCEPQKKGIVPADRQDSDTSSTERKKTVQESEDNGYHLIIRNLTDKSSDTVRFVTSYVFAEEAPVLVCSTSGGEDETAAGVLVIDLERNRRSEIFNGKGRFRQLTVAKDGKRAAFLMTADMKDKTGNNYSLFWWKGSGNALLAANQGTPGIPEKWIISENGQLVFAEKSQRLFFGTSPENRIRDTTILDEDRPNVDVWHYAEGKLHTVQVIDRERDMKKTYTAVFHCDRKTVVQLATPEMPDTRLIDKGDSPKILASSNLPYQLRSMWEGGNTRNDYWLVDVFTGMPQKIKENYRARIQPSPAGRYLYWYHGPDSSWYSYSISEGKEYRLTDPSTLPCHNELNDVPDLPPSYPPAGWLKDDRAFLISDRYDIWMLDPAEKNPPANITINGREKKITYSLLRLDTENDYIDPAELQYLAAFNEKTKGSAFYSLSLKKKNEPLFLSGGDYLTGRPLKAGKGSRVIYTIEDFSRFPDYYLSDLSFRGETKVTDANPRQEEFLWGTAELVSWTSLDGKETEGLLYKPEGFDPSRKYPMIVNFYEKSSSGLFSHRIPEPGRSTIDYHYYTSNGYLVFNPDVHYQDGYPGQSAFNCVIPGIMALIEKGFVDEKRIGAQGHSWGGYQVAYLATRTNLFAAIESGAPVVNMYSAYGGIRWETGLNRSFQYEHQQSRIGATIWEAPHTYWENSPLFFTDKVNTPILIMANDKDGHVPWYQGIEYFIALRRLGKPAWLLNYSGEPHWPLKHPNKVDFQKRMSQFFAHYLKGEPMPVWMKEGVPATEKDFTSGY
ncbi:MAG TPA: prolyl oligopeptidase family serine peptidase [Bacteroidales bacterium]|jgi:dipeptidyl aminopeptidase/acylaminoacyl peptidase|nr:prolyl oligopeptidase family serine peptidase [Bacteroidales bacterium]HQH23096.1 prolyl oligopeptidase family serine peptidase [Bacteroidales bacterium]